MKSDLEYNELDSPTHRTIAIRVPKELWDAAVAQIKQREPSAPWEQIMSSGNQTDRAALKVVTHIGFMKGTGT